MQNPSRQTEDELGVARSSVLALVFCFGEYKNVCRAFQGFTHKLSLIFHKKP